MSFKTLFPLYPTIHSESMKKCVLKAEIASEEKNMNDEEAAFAEKMVQNEM